MKRLSQLSLVLLLFAFIMPVDSAAQRRSRPGSMRHSQSEVDAQRKETKVACKYIHDGAIFEGPVHMVGQNGGIKIGDAAIIFNNGKYKLSFDAAKFKITKYPVTMSDAERARLGITKYEQENTWEYKKLGEDFEYGGRYATIRQYGQLWLILYNTDSDDIYAKIELDSADANSFELLEDDMLVRMSYTK